VLIDFERISRHMGDAKVVVDVGGGGDELRSMHPRVSHIIDIFPPSQSIAAKAEAAGVEFLVGDAADPETWDNLRADYVICSHTLEDSFDPIPVMRSMNRFAERGYIEFPSVAQEVLPINSIYGSAHHSWFATVQPKEWALGEVWTRFTRPKNEVRGDTRSDIMLCFLPKILAFADGLRWHRYRVPHARRFKRRKWWRRPYMIADESKTWTGILWSGSIDGAVINCENFQAYKHMLQSWVDQTTAHPHVFET
jgi:hypothetical protein